MIKRVAAAAAVVATLAAGTMTASADTIAPNAGNTQITGADRYSLAVAASQKTFKQPGIDLVVVATGASFADGLAGGAVAGNSVGPLLLTPSTTLPKVVADELRRLSPAAVMLAGGTASVSSGVEAAVKAAVPGAEIIREGGANRYAVAANISKDYYASGTSTVYIASGRGYADAVSASSAAALTAGPLLLADRSLPAETRAELTRLNNLGILESVVVLGGTGSVSAGTYAEIDRIVGKNPADGYNKTVRVGGKDRYAVSANLASILWDGAQSPAAKTAYYVNGATWADALASGPAAAAHDAPVLLTSKSCMPAATKAWDSASNGTLTSRIWVGGSASLQVSTSAC